MYGMEDGGGYWELKEDRSSYRDNIKGLICADCFKQCGTGGNCKKHQYHQESDEEEEKENRMTKGTMRKIKRKR